MSEISSLKIYEELLPVVQAWFCDSPAADPRARGGPAQGAICSIPTATDAVGEWLNWEKIRGGFRGRWRDLRWCCEASGQGKGWEEEQEEVACVGGSVGCHASLQVCAQAARASQVGLCTHKGLQAQTGT